MATTLGFADHSVGKTYRRIRYLVAAALILMPLLTALAGTIFGHALQESLSDYYFVERDGGLPRTLFVMFLAFLGGVLISYRGLDRGDNIIHNIAGAFSFGVALFPMRCLVSEHQFCEPGLLPQLHGLSAGLLYASAAVSVIYGGGPTLRNALLRLPDPKEWIARLRTIQSLSTLLMGIGILTFFFHKPLRPFFPSFSFIFWIEYLGFFGFGIYWVRLMWLINDANKKGIAMVPAGDEQVTSTSVDQSSRSRTLDSAQPRVEPWTPIP